MTEELSAALAAAMKTANQAVDPMERQLATAAADSFERAMTAGWAAAGPTDPLTLLLPDGIPLTTDVINSVERITKRRPLTGLPKPEGLGGGHFAPEPVHARVALRRWAARAPAYPGEEEVPE